MSDSPEPENSQHDNTPYPFLHFVGPVKRRVWNMVKERHPRMNYQETTAETQKLLDRWVNETLTAIVRD